MTNRLLFFVCAAFCAAISGLPNAISDDLPEQDEDRLQRLEQLALAAADVRVDRVQDPVHTVVEGRRLSRSGELHFRFLTSLTAVENERDGLVLVPIEVSGFSRTVDSASGGQPQETVGADLQKARVVIKGLLGEETPQASIELPGLNHGSPYPADQLARDELNALIEWYLPEAAINGVRKFNEKRLVVDNPNDEPVTVWVRWRTEVRLKTEYEWVWYPKDGEAQQFTVPPKTSQSFDVEQPSRVGQGQLTASRVRIWAESETGLEWNEYKNQDLWLVESNPQLNGELAYHAEQIEPYVYHLTPSTEPRAFSERLVALQNDSPEPLDVQLRYRTSSGGDFRWQTLRVQVPPGELLRPRDAQGMRVRASLLYLTADSENRRYRRQSERPLFLVDEVQGRRLYSADKIGEFVYRFDPAGPPVGEQSATVRVAQAKLQNGSQVVGTLPQGAELEVLDRKEGWVRVRAVVDGQEQTGWVRDSSLELSGATPQAAPTASARSLTVTAREAEVRFGETVIATVAKGRKFAILDENESFYRIEVVVSGEALYGWVRKKDVKVE